MRELEKYTKKPEVRKPYGNPDFSYGKGRFRIMGNYGTS